MEYLSWGDGVGLVSVDGDDRVRSYRGADEWVEADHMLEGVRTLSLSFDRITADEAQALKAEIDARVAALS